MYAFRTPAMRFPKLVAAPRLQSWLLLTALVSMVLVGLLVVDLARTLRTAVISDTQKALLNASKELNAAGSTWLATHSGVDTARPDVDADLKRVSYDILRSYPEVEGGFIFNGHVLGHTFPTYTEPESNLSQPANERDAVAIAIEKSFMTGMPANRVMQDGSDLVIVSGLASPDGRLAVWCLRRIISFSDSSEVYKRMILIAVLLVALVAIGIVLKLSVNLQRGFASIQAGLDRLGSDAAYRLPEQGQELQPIVAAVNSMAAERQVLEAELRREDRLRVMGRVVAGIAHEIRNPLNSIRLTIRLLGRRLDHETASKEPIALVTSEVDRLDNLLKSLLVFRPDASEKVRQQPIRPIVERTVALVKPHAEESAVTIERQSCDDDLALVNGEYLQQALMNLMLNAIDASGPNGRVGLSVTREENHLLVDIEDTGPGLTIEEQEHLFEAFYTTKSGGTGLGLAVTRTLLEKMGGTIVAMTGARGAKFRITLPTGQIA